MARKKTIDLPRMPKLPEPPVSRIGIRIRPIMPKVSRPASFGQGPRGVLPGLVTDVQAYPPAPADFVGTRPEWLVYWVLTKLGYTPGEDFTFQSSQLGPRFQAGAAVIDFLILNRQPRLSLRVQGMFWHYEGGTAKQAKDQLQRQELEEQGIEVVDLDEDDILANPFYVVEQGLAGIDVSHAKLRDM